MQENENRNFGMDSHLKTQFYQIWRVSKESRKSGQWHQEQGISFSSFVLDDTYLFYTNGCGYSNVSSWEQEF